MDNKIIGKGTYGSVVKGSLKFNKNKKFAIKIINKFHSSSPEILNEIEVVRKLDHPNLIRFCETFVSNS